MSGNPAPEKVAALAAALDRAANADCGDVTLHPDTVLAALNAAGYDVARIEEREREMERRDAYWRSTLRDVGARPVTCRICGGTGTVNAAETEPCVCDGGSEWVVGGASQ